jgi:hypothetical protein
MREAVSEESLDPQEYSTPEYGAMEDRTNCEEEVFDENIEELMK